MAIGMGECREKVRGQMVEVCSICFRAKEVYMHTAQALVWGGLHLALLDVRYWKVEHVLYCLQELSLLWKHLIS